MPHTRCVGQTEYMNWRFLSKCANTHPDFFFPAVGRASQKIKDFCRDCPVIAECLEDALKSNDGGIRAGTTEAERRAMQRYLNPTSNLNTTSAPLERKFTWV